VRITFQDSSTITVGDDSALVVDESVFDPKAGSVNSYLRLLKGKVRALVSEYYKDPTASYSIGTTTAVSGVRGTDFIVVYDEAQSLTEVIGITGRVEVHGTIDLKENGVFITPGLFTRVARGKMPTAAQPIGSEEMRRHLDSLYLVGSGAGVSAEDPILAGGDVPSPDRPSTPGTTPPGPTAPPATGDDEGVDRSSPSDVAGEPIGAVENVGNVEIPFQRSGRP
jgi:hypothetical protein